LFGEASAIVVRGEFAFRRGLGYAAVQVPARGERAAGTAYLVFQPTRLWIKPVSSAGLPQGALWVSTAPAAARSPTSSLAFALEGMNPQLLLEEIAAGAVAASSSGHRVVDHVPYAQYDVTVDPARALAATRTTGALRVAMQRQLAALRAVGAPARLRIVVGVDGAERLAQLRFSLPGSKLGTVQIALWKFGRPIPLSLPLAAETVDIASLGRTPASLSAGRVLTGE